MRSSKSKLKASVYWRTRGQFWKLNQVYIFCDQNKRKPIRLLLFNARACDRTGSRNQIRWSGNRPLYGLESVQWPLIFSLNLFPSWRIVLLKSFTDPCNSMYVSSKWGWLITRSTPPGSALVSSKCFLNTCIQGNMLFVIVIAYIFMLLVQIQVWTLGLLNKTETWFVKQTCFLVPTFSSSPGNNLLSIFYSFCFLH